MPRSTHPLSRATLFAFTLASLSLGACSGGGGDSTGTGGTGSGSGGSSGTGGSGSGSGGSSGGGTLAYTPCADANRFGTFSLQLVGDNDPPYTQMNGSVSDKIDTRKVWSEEMKSGECRVMTGPAFTCATACVSPQYCSAKDTCSDAPALVKIGTVSISGLVAPLDVMPLGAGVYSGSLPATTAFPPATPGGVVGFSATGDVLPAFSLEGRGIEPVVAPAAAIPLVSGQAMNVSWTAPSAGGSTRMVLALDIAHHGGIAAEIECDVPDTGSATIPAALVDALVAHGKAGFPTITLSRRTVDSTTVGTGCAEFSVVSTVSREITVAGIKSCADESDCDSGQTCRADLTCG